MSLSKLAAVSLGASAWQLFWRVTLPNIRWALLFGIIQCHARAIGEFGAVYVVSGHIAGETDTMPLRVEKLFQEYNNPASFAVASLLTLMALITLGAKLALEHWSTAERLDDDVPALAIIPSSTTLSQRPSKSPTTPLASEPS